MMSVIKTILIFSLFLCTCGIYSQKLYDPFTIQELYLNFPFSDWDAKLDSLHTADSDARLIAPKAIINGKIFDSVGVRYKGNSTYNATRNKNPFNIKLDFIKSSQDYDGYNTLKLSNGFMDPSFLREVMAYKIASQYLPCSKANFIKVYVNNIFIGLYTNVENISADFLSSNYYSKHGAFFQCDRPDKQVTVPSSCMPANAGSALRYASPDSNCYKNSYEIQSDYGWSELLKLMLNLANNTSQIKSYLDVDRALWMIALNNFYANFDSYTGSGHNYLIYQDLNNRFNTIPWDFNEFYGSFTNSGTGNLTVQQMIELSPTLHISNADRPLISKLIGVPAYNKRYLAHLWTILDDAVASHGYDSLGLQWQKLINTSVLLDKNKFFTDAAFQSNLYSNYSANGGMGGGKTYPGLIDFTNARINYLKNTTEFGLIRPTIIYKEIYPLQPKSNSMIEFHANAVNTTQLSLFYRFVHSEVFKEVQMFDDGLHHDGQASDQIFGTDISVQNQKKLEYYYYASNDKAAVLSPARAEYEFHELLIEPEIKLEGEIKLNEIMSSNTNFISDQNGEFDDWIELKNTSPNRISIQGLYLSDNYNNLLKWSIPDTAVASDTYLIVWADEDANQKGLHANFKCSKSGENIYLSRFDGKILDSANYINGHDNYSFERCNETWIETSKPSFALKNNCLSNLVVIDKITPTIQISNPFSDQIYWKILQGEQKCIQLHVYNLLGSTIFKDQFYNSKESIKTSDWNNGVYIFHFKIEDNDYNFKLVKI